MFVEAFGGISDIYEFDLQLLQQEHSKNASIAALTFVDISLKFQFKCEKIGYLQEFVT